VSFLSTLPERLAPAHTALLVIDMQNDFCAADGYVERVLGKDASPCRAIVAPIAELAQRARASHVPVLWIRADYSPDKVPAHLALKAHERGSTAPFCHGGSWGAAFFELTPASGEPVIEKHCFSAFVGTGLEERLRAAGIRTVILTGVQTNACIESSLRDAASMGFHVVVPADCVASHTHVLHEATLKNVAFLFGDVVASAEIARIWQGAVGAAARTVYPEET
jgi:ureidoacrylate peracid hydrolase